MAALLRPGAKRRRCRASFNAPPTPGQTGGSHCAAAAPMNLHPLQQTRGAYRELLVGLLGYSLPTLVFPLVGSPAHSFRLRWRPVPAALSVTAELAHALINPLALGDVDGEREKRTDPRASPPVLAASHREHSTHLPRRGGRSGRPRLLGARFILLGFRKSLLDRLSGH
jgi:hypothetical protein